MAEKVKTTGVSKEKGFLYYLGKDGNVWRSVCHEADLAAEMQKKLLMQALHVKADSYTSSIKTEMYHAHLWLEVEVKF